MARKGYLSVYVDERTEEIFSEFCRIKGIKKAVALSEMLELYMLSQDEELYLNLKKQSYNVDGVSAMILDSINESQRNDYIFMKLGVSSTASGEDIDGKETMQAYIQNLNSNDIGYTWFSTRALASGMSQKKVDYYNNLAETEPVKVLFAVDNEIAYSAKVLQIVSSRDEIICPDEVSGVVPEEFGEAEVGKIWLKLTDIQPEGELKAENFYIPSTGRNLRRTINESQYTFGYVALNE